MNEQYTTSDTAEAAYLMAHGAQFIKVEKNNNDPKVSIILEETDEVKIGDLLIRWDLCNCFEKSFFLKYKWLLRQVAPKNGNNKEI
jgi:hypothetical protein